MKTDKVWPPGVASLDRRGHASPAYDPHDWLIDLDTDLPLSGNIHDMLSAVLEANVGEGTVLATVVLSC